MKRELRGSLKELKHLQKLNCGFISCYSRSVEIVEESKIFQLCSTYMDTSDDNFDLNDFLGIGVNVVYHWTHMKHMINIACHFAILIQKRNVS